MLFCEVEVFQRQPPWNLGCWIGKVPARRVARFQARGWGPLQHHFSRE